VVEEDEERPVDEPGSLLQGLQGGTEHALVDKLSETVEILKGSVPVLHEDLRGKLTPHTVEIVHVGRLDENTMEIQVFTCSGVISALILNL